MKGRLNFFMTKFFDGVAFLEPGRFGQLGQRLIAGNKKIHPASGKLCLYKGPESALEKLPQVRFAQRPGKGKGNPRQALPGRGPIQHKKCRPETPAPLEKRLNPGFGERSPHPVYFW